MTKEDLNQMCREYQQVLSMSESEVFTMYEESKSECIASFEAEIDFWENYFDIDIKGINTKKQDYGNREKNPVKRVDETELATR